MKDKLLVSGCSYTQYLYPTWSDWLGEHFDEYVNLGMSGTGARYSYLKILNFLNSPNINPSEYIVIVQWSSLLRHDYRRNPNNNWSGGGQIDNNELYDEKYLKEYFNPLDKLNDLVYYIDHLVLLSKKLKFKLLMTYMFEPWIQDFLGEPVFHKINKEHIKNIKQSSYLKILKEHTEKSYWINPSIERYSLDNPPRHLIKSTYENGPQREHHPSPYQHWLYSKVVAQKLRKKMNVKYKKLSLDLSRFLATNYNDLKLKKVFINPPGKFLPHKKLESIIKELV